MREHCIYIYITYNIYIYYINIYMYIYIYIYNESWFWLNNKTEKIWHLFVCPFISLLLLFDAILFICHRHVHPDGFLYFFPFFNIITWFNISGTEMGSTSIYSCSHTENHFYIAFIILLLNQLKYVRGTKYFATDCLAV